MYKVFVNDRPIILTDSLKNENNFPVYNFKNVVINEILHKLNSNSENGILIFCENLVACWKKFLANFGIISAAGGLVLNQQKEILFIYRNGKWDLPKGKIEKNETIEHTAIREVEEECSIANLTIEKFLITTYHFFYQNNEKKLKETHWFLMHSNFIGELKPQFEEGITKVIFKNKEEIILALKNTYANIQLVYDTFLETK